MPRGDRTGPAGQGPMSGRGAGFCAGYGTPGFANPLPGGNWGVGCGARGGRGWRNMYYATGLPGWLRSGSAPAWAANVPAPTREQQTEALKAQAKALQEQIDTINKRLAELVDAD